MAVVVKRRALAVGRAAQIVGVLLAAMTTASCADLFYDRVSHSIANPHKRGKSERAGKAVKHSERKVVANASASAAVPATPSAREGNVGTEERITTAAARMASELAAYCPVVDPSDQKAFERCKAAMFGASELRSVLSHVTLWGRQNKDASKTLNDTNLTQFSVDVLAGLYMPLFMYDGSYKVEYSETEKLYRVEVGALFRNRLQPGQFPYPFWHDDERWGAYQGANGLIFRFEPDRPRVLVAQFTVRGSLRLPTQTQHVGHSFDGKWM
jgi:hypothetical protein